MASLKQGSLLLKDGHLKTVSGVVGMLWLFLREWQ